MAFRKVDNNNKSHKIQTESKTCVQSYSGVEREVTAGILVKSGSDYFSFAKGVTLMKITRGRMHSEILRQCIFKTNNKHVSYALVFLINDDKK